MAKSAKRSPKRSSRKRSPNKYIKFVMKWKKEHPDRVKALGHIGATKEAAAAYRKHHGLAKPAKKSRKSKRKKSRK